MIILSGLGLNYKTSIINRISELRPDLRTLESSSFIFKELQSHLHPLAYGYQDKITMEYALIRYSKPDICDRGPEDALIFQFLKANMEIANIWDHLWVYLDATLDGYLKLIKSIDAKRYFLRNENWSWIEQYLRNNDTVRLDLYTNVQEYRKLQNRFEEVYSELIGDHELIVLIDTPEIEVEKVTQLILTEFK